MRQDKLALEKLAAKFVESTLRAEESITRLKTKRMNSRSGSSGPRACATIWPS
jgi:hypothetical protein